MRKMINGVITGAIFVVMQGIGFLTKKAKDKNTHDMQPVPATNH